MPFIKRNKWTEAAVNFLPAGEHDFFDRKSGRLYAKDTNEFLGDIAKAISAFANSGGGSLVLGVADDGVPDGLPPAVGRTPIREWLEQKIPQLVDYAISDFRVLALCRPSRSPVSPQEKTSLW
jgi:hypothetical protein